MNDLSKEELEYEKDKEELKRTWDELKDLINVNPFPFFMIITALLITCKLLFWREA